MQEILLSTEFIITICVLMTIVAAIIGLLVYERRTRESLNPKMLPSMALMFSFAILALLALVHLVNLLGIHTGR